MKISTVAVLSLLAITCVTIPVYAQKYLTGELSGIYLQGEYIVSGNIHVLPKAKLSFEPGCVLRFENFAGIVVRGELITRGTSSKPVVFSSSRDVPGTRTMPEAFDWIGIKVTSEAVGITLENCLLSYSSFGLNIESNTTPVSIKDIKFNNNGSASLTREKKMMPVTDNMAISFSWPEISGQSQTVAAAPAPDISSEKTTPVKTKKKTVNVRQKKEKARPKFMWIPPVRISAGSAAAVGGIMWISGFMVSEQNKKITQDPVSNYQEKLDADKKYKTWIAVQNTGIALFCAGAVGFSVTFLF